MEYFYDYLDDSIPQEKLGTCRYYSGWTLRGTREWIWGKMVWGNESWSLGVQRRCEMWNGWNILKLQRSITVFLQPMNLSLSIICVGECYFRISIRNGWIIEFSQKYKWSTQNKIINDHHKYANRNKKKERHDSTAITMISSLISCLKRQLWPLSSQTTASLLKN